MLHWFCEKYIKKRGVLNNDHIIRWPKIITKFNGPTRHWVHSMLTFVPTANTDFFLYLSSNKINEYTQLIVLKDERVNQLEEGLKNLQQNSDVSVILWREFYCLKLYFFMRFRTYKLVIKN